MAIKLILFNRPGVGSAFTPIAEIVHKWSTSVKDTSIRIGVLIGIHVGLSVPGRRKIFLFSIGFTKASNSSSLNLCIHRISTIGGL